MSDETCNLFQRVAQKMGWAREGGLDEVEKELLETIGRSRHGATSSYQSMDGEVQSLSVPLLDNKENDNKENKCFKGNGYRNKSLIESSDDDFDHFLVGKATPKNKVTPHKPWSAAKKDSSTVQVVSSDNDDDFETFLQRVKTPAAKPKNRSESTSEDSLKSFIVDDASSDDDFIEKSPVFKVPPKTKIQSSQRRPLRPLSCIDSPVFVSDSDDEDNIVIKSTWRTRHSRPLPKANNKTALLVDKVMMPPPSPSILKTPTSPATPKHTVFTPTTKDNSSSSDDEFASLLERLTKTNNITPRNTYGNKKERPASDPLEKGFKKPLPKSLGETPPLGKTPKAPIPKAKVSLTEPRLSHASRHPFCKTPGCFLQTLSDPETSYCRSFKSKKEELTCKLYQLYNTSVFDSKLPVNMSVTWNKKMRKTAGYCITGQERGGGNRYARIELSEKVCDSADRLRDTLIHEMCHAATWLINGVRDGHGNFWKLYARKATLAHPELPMVTRCHSYDIKYKFQYQCTRCKNTIGRHSKSLDTQRFACAHCMGQLVLLTPSKPRAPTPFANFVKENYSSVRQELAGKTHGEVMRKLSADFASQAKLT